MFEKCIENITNTHGDLSNENQKFPRDSYDIFLLAVTLKNKIRQRKSAQKIYATYTENAKDESETKKIIEKFLENKRSFVGKNFFIFHNSFAHTMLIILFLNKQLQLECFLVSSLSSDHYFEKLFTVFDSFNIKYFILNTEAENKLQHSNNECSWFALEYAFHLSKIENMSEVLTRCPQIKIGHKITVEIRDLPKELYRAFLTSAQSHKHFNDNNSKEIIGSHQRTLSDIVTQHNGYFDFITQKQSRNQSIYYFIQKYVYRLHWLIENDSCFLKEVKNTFFDDSNNIFLPHQIVANIDALSLKPFDPNLADSHAYIYHSRFKKAENSLPPARRRGERVDPDEVRRLFPILTDTIKET